MMTKLAKVAQNSEMKRRTLHPCPACDANGVVDFIDLVRGRAQLHCPECPTSWAEQTEATMQYLTVGH